MKRLFLATALLATTSLSYAEDYTLNEIYSVDIDHLSVMVDNAKHDIKVTATWNYKKNPQPSDYIDSNLVVATITNFFKEYPNKTDFWEVVNHKLVSHLIDKFKMVHAMSVKLDVPPIKADPHHHYTLVEATRNN